MYSIKYYNKYKTYTYIYMYMLCLGFIDSKYYHKFNKKMLTVI